MVSELPGVSAVEGITARQIDSWQIRRTGRFDHVHLDTVGPLPEYNGYKYCVTMLDRFSRWPEAIPTRDITAQTIARIFFDNWIARFGSPKTLTTDQGSQFESQLFTALLSLVGCQRGRTTPYHPASNGLIERWHRPLKAAIMCHLEKDWTRVLSTVLLGLRTHVRLDINASPSEFLYGHTVRYNASNSERILFIRRCYTRSSYIPWGIP